jgi:hypothetical protein
MNTDITIITSDEGDWIAVYQGEQLIDQGHSLGEASLLKGLGFNVTEIEWGEKEFEDYGGRCPVVKP